MCHPYLLEVIYAPTLSLLFLMEIRDDRDSSMLSIFDTAIYFYSLTLLSLVSLPVFYNSGPIKVGDISSSLLNPESDQASNSAANTQRTS